MKTLAPSDQASQHQVRDEGRSLHSPRTHLNDARPAATAQMRMQSLMANSAQTAPLKLMQSTIAASTQAKHAQLPIANSSVLNSPMQRMEDDETLQVKTDEPPQHEQTAASLPVKPNNTSLPDNLKNGIENLSGINMDHVRVYYNSDKPAQLQAHAYAQGSEIHVAPGQEKHLPHEAWHVVQQAQGRVKPGVQMKGDMNINEDEGLEKEADAMGARALQAVSLDTQKKSSYICSATQKSAPVQRVNYNDEKLNAKRRTAKVGLELAFNDSFTQKHFGNKGYESSTDYLIDSVKEKVNDYRARWIARAQTDATNNQWILAVTQEAHPQGADHIFGDFGRTKFTYTTLKLLNDPQNPDNLNDPYNKPDDMSQDDHGTWIDFDDTEMEPYSKKRGTWWWGLTIDPAVFELQSQPTTWQVINNTNVRSITTTSIFGGATALGLKADKGMGGGQINIDFQTGLDGDYNKVLESINNLEKNKGEFENSGLDESDDINAPYIYNSTRVDFANNDTKVEAETIKREWDTIYKQHINKINDADAWALFVTDYTNFLKKYPSAKQRAKDFEKRIEPFFGENDHQDDIFHFQALNVGHIGKSDKDARRIEFRDLRAQKDIDDILAAMDLCFSVIPDAN